MATNLLKPVKLASPVVRQYTNLAGVDFMNEATRVALNRSPDALNLYKNYEESGECLVTRPGYRVLEQFIDETQINNIGKINGLYFWEKDGESFAIVHCGKSLYKWNYMSGEENNITKFNEITMNDSKSQYIVFQDYLYILDGKNYIRFDGTIIEDVKNIAYIPTSTIGREPSGGGEIYQPINVLQKKRINQFVADGSSVAYALDATNIDADTVQAIVNGNTLIENTDFTVDRINGIVYFITAPTAPSISGKDNVFITFSKTIEGYNDRIENCNLMLVFDNRIFFSGNPNFKNAIFHSKLENPLYVSDLDYYQDGLDEASIKSMCVGNNILWVFKESNQQNNSIFYHVPTLDTENGRIYPAAKGNISTGCNSVSCNFNDDIVFMTDYGLVGISGYINSEQILSHRSTMINSRLTNEENLEDLTLTEWQGYLLVLANGKVFLADSRQLFKGIKGKEYEWYFWDGISSVNRKLLLMREHKGKLYLGFSDGTIAIMDGTDDDGRIISSYWTTPADLFGSDNHYKTTNKRGGTIKLKTIPNSKIKVAVKTNKTETYRYIKEFAMSGFDFSNLDFENLMFGNMEKNYLIVKIKEKKFVDLSIKIYSDEINRPFGLYGITIESFIGGYIKK